MPDQARKLKLLGGSPAEKKELFDEFLAVIMEGGELSEADRSMFEFLKEYFTASAAPIVANISATARGQGGLQ